MRFFKVFFSKRERERERERGRERGREGENSPSGHRFGCIPGGGHFGTGRAPSRGQSRNDHKQ